MVREAPSREALLKRLEHHYAHGKEFLEHRAREALRRAQVPTVELVKVAQNASRPTVKSWRRSLLGRYRMVDPGLDTTTPLMRDALGWDLGVYTFRINADARHSPHSDGSFRYQWHAVLLTESHPGDVVVRAAAEQIDAEYHRGEEGLISPPIPAGSGRLFLQASGIHRPPGSGWVIVTTEGFALAASVLAGLSSWTLGECGCSQEAKIDLYNDDFAKARKWAEEDPRFIDYVT